MFAYRAGGAGMYKAGRTDMYRELTGFLGVTKNRNMRTESYLFTYDRVYAKEDMVAKPSSFNGICTACHEGRYK